MILTLYGLLLFWILNEKLREMGDLVRVTKEKLEKVEKNLSILLESGHEGGENENQESIEERFSFHLLQREKDKEKGE